ncbi:2-dehydropantoate 2-reductase family [Grosmannia clavigera kw1407]|uniref:2-dehydropantoate 2-reductase family n=1 Tax=Grosmannia clavigera (strain kw1407 / UAMH 11150) TaxID=655863 RepID=F0XPH1_GROCL|nr:2-dehydropantoate 2-reductase family [Grosmannia clavigera kw1407]EFX00252.1 2-dehydropantoate 2-reductase family [Grosmannia clavigera kw1407]
MTTESTMASKTAPNETSETSQTDGGMTPQQYRVCLIGSGGVGTIASLVLSKSQRAHVTVVLRSAYEHVTRHGWQVDSVDHGELAGWRPARVVDSVAAATREADDNGIPILYDYVVVCTKQQPPECGPTTPELIGPVVTAGHTTVVLIQNGMGIEEAVIAAWPTNVVMSSVSHIGSALRPPNTVVQTAPDVSQMGPHYHVGVPDAVSRARAQTFVDLYVAGGARACHLLQHRMQAARWEKLLWNGTFSPVCALTRANVGQVQRSGARDSLLLPMMWEIWHVAAAAGHPLPESVVPWMAGRLPDDCTFRPSMLLDLEAGRPMELDVILGYPTRLARRLGVATPVLDTAYRLLQVEQWKVLGE